MTITLMNVTLSPLVAIAVFAATVVTDAVYVFFTAAVTSRQRFRAAKLELDLVSPLRLLGDQLYRQSGLRCVRRFRLMGRRLSVGDLAQSGQSGRAHAAGCAVRLRASTASVASADKATACKKSSDSLSAMNDTCRGDAP
jgi:hypothetical protein